MPRPLIIDTDPGIDDAFAILMALAAPELEVLALTAVAGNRPLAVTERNARALCELAGRPDIKVHAGCDRPLRRPLYVGVRAHGDSGLGRLELPPPQALTAPGHGADAIAAAVREAAPGALTLCALGPLTNLATALARAPDIAGRIGEIVLMGGASMPLGNVSPVAEFNIWVDPDAAAQVFASGVPITMVPLDVTEQLRTGPARLKRLAALGNRAGAAAVELLGPVAATGRPMTLHDPCVIAYLLRPDLFRGKRVNVAIECDSELTRGMSVIDRRGVSGRAANALVLDRVDAAGFYALLTELLARLP
jgi:purine nucleosidase